MLPRFLKTFLLASLLLIIPTLFILYQKHSPGTEWNEWSLTSGAWDSWNVDQKPSSDINDRQDSALYFEDHWNAGGAAPKYRSEHTVVAELEDDPQTGARVYRIGEILISTDELEAYREWKDAYRSETPLSGHDEETPSQAHSWRDESLVHGTVIMPKLGNSTAKYVLSPDIGLDSDLRLPQSRAGTCSMEITTFGHVEISRGMSSCDCYASS